MPAASASAKKQKHILPKIRRLKLLHVGMSVPTVRRISGESRQQARSTSPEMSAAEIGAILDSFEIQSEGPESEEAEEDPVVAPHGRPDLRWCTKRHTYSCLRKGGCTNRGCAAC